MVRQTMTDVASVAVVVGVALWRPLVVVAGWGVVELAVVAVQFPAKQGTHTRAHVT